MEKNGALNEEVKNLKREQEEKSILLCEITKLKKKAEEDRDMIEEEKIHLVNRIEEKKLDVQKLANMHLDTMNQLMIANQELNRKEIEIKNLET